MIDAEDFLNAAAERGYDFYTGVPCSFLTPFINATITAPALTYVGAASEGEAVGIAAGAWLAGRKTVVMCQNSGLGNTVNPLTSLNYPFRIPTMLITTWRGQPGVKDEPQHKLMGQITHKTLDVMEIAHEAFPTEAADVAGVLDRAEAGMDETGLPYGLVMAKGSVRSKDVELPALSPRPAGQRIDLCDNGPRPGRAELLACFLDHVPEQAPVLATTGKTGRELFTLADREQHLYQVGSMGCAGAMGLGVALNCDLPVAVLDGDGAALMKLGALATIGAYRPEKLVHIVLDNGVHDSTGGQATVSPIVDFASVAIACGYAKAYACDSLDGFAKAIAEAFAGQGPSLIHARIQPGSMDNLGRPTVKPPQVAERFKSFLARATA